MAISDVQIALSVGWGIRGLFWLLLTGLALIRSDSPRSRVLLSTWFLVTTSMVGPVAEYFDLGLRFARLSEVAVGSLFVGVTIAAVFKLDPVSAIRGVTSLIAFNVLYTLAAVTTSASLEAALLVIGSAFAVAGLLSLRFGVPGVWRYKFIIMVAAALFYFAVALQTIFGPWVLNEWNRLTWAIVWEVSITTFYLTLGVMSWFSYTAGTPDVAYASDWWDAAIYWMKTNRWAEPPAKIID